MRAFFTVLTLLFILLQYKLWFGAEGIAQTLYVKHETNKDLVINQQLNERNQEMINHINYLKNNKEAIESLARENLGMVKKGETYYQFLNA